MSIEHPSPAEDVPETTHTTVQFVHIPSQEERVKAIMALSKSRRVWGREGNVFDVTGEQVKLLEKAKIVFNLQ